MIKRVENFEIRPGVRPFSESISRIRDRAAVAKILIRVGEGVIELKIDFGPGYRAYIGLRGDGLIILLCAGDKASQDADISRAIGYWREYRRSQ